MVINTMPSKRSFALHPEDKQETHFRQKKRPRPQVETFASPCSGCAEAGTLCTRLFGRTACSRCVDRRRRCDLRPRPSITKIGASSSSQKATGKKRAFLYAIRNDSSLIFLVTNGSVNRTAGRDGSGTVSSIRHSNSTSQNQREPRLLIRKIVAQMIIRATRHTTKGISHMCLFPALRRTKLAMRRRQYSQRKDRLGLMHTRWMSTRMLLMATTA